MRQGKSVNVTSDPSGLLEKLKQLDIDRLASDCARMTDAQEETARDAVLDILCAIWSDRSRYEKAFRQTNGLYRYIKISAIRHLFRVHKAKQRYHILEPEDTAGEQLTAEEQMLRLLASRKDNHWLEQAKRSLEPKEASALRKLLNKVLKKPETYIHTRQSGNDSGQYVFHYSRLAEDLKWPRRRVYQVLAHLRQALLEQQPIHGEEI